MSIFSRITGSHPKQVATKPSSVFQNAHNLVSSDGHETRIKYLYAKPGTDGPRFKVGHGPRNALQRLAHRTEARKAQTDLRKAAKALMPHYMNRDSDEVVKAAEFFMGKPGDQLTDTYRQNLFILAAAEIKLNKKLEDRETYIRGTHDTPPPPEVRPPATATVDAPKTVASERPPYVENPHIEFVGEPPASQVSTSSTHEFDDVLKALDDIERILNGNKGT